MTRRHIFSKLYFTHLTYYTDNQKSDRQCDQNAYKDIQKDNKHNKLKRIETPGMKSLQNIGQKPGWKSYQGTKFVLFIQ